MGLSGNPVLDHLDQKYSELHPLAQAAIQKGLLTGGIPGGGPVQDAPQPSAATFAGIPGVAHQEPAPAAAPAPIAAPTQARPIAPRESPAESALAAEHTRLTSGETGKSGISQIHNPFLRGLAHVGEAAGMM